MALLDKDSRFEHGALKSTSTDLEATSAAAAAAVEQEEATKNTLEEGMDDDNDELVFPLAGMNLFDCPPRLRFAPSPTGSLHVGGARTALYNWLSAKKGQLDFPRENSGFIVRVEDTDLARSTKESEASVMADLKWLGLDWDEGPMDSEPSSGPFGPYRQSERDVIYKKVARRLLREGRAYRCFCSQEELEEMRAQQEAAGIPPRYDNRWRDADPKLVEQKMKEGVPYTVRFKVPEGARVVIDDVVRGTVAWDAESTVGDFILLRSGSGVPVYNFCVAVDDAMMGITTVVRAEEHLTNTLRQALILDALGAPRPRYAHCSLILGEDKQKLSKRHGATSCNQFRLDGFLPDAMINYLSLLGWNDGTDNEIFSREELVESFQLERVVKSPSVFDMDKLKWVNSQHMKAMSVNDLKDLVKEQMFLEEMIVDGADSQGIENMAFSATALAKQMMETTKDAALNAKQVLGYGLPPSFQDMSSDEHKEALDMIKMGNFFKIAMAIVEDFEAGKLPLPNADDAMESFLDEQGNYAGEYKDAMKKLAKSVKTKGRNFFHPLRLALTGEMSGQDVAKQLPLLELSKGVVVPDMIIEIPERMQRLKDFCESIPEEFRNPIKAETKSKENTASSQSSTSGDSAAAQTNPSTTTVVDPWETYTGPPITALDIRVGKVLKVWEHQDADKLYCEEIDVGEETPRQVASGLRPYLKAEDIEGRHVLVLCNLKSRNLVGFPSHGMVLCASNSDHTEVRLVSPPVDAKIGERVTLHDVDFSGEAAEPFAENKIGKKKVLQALAPYLVTNDYGIPEFLGRPFMTSAGACTSPIPKGSVS
eukprot:CAMPEP_0118719068 /NCGR_PEP_ID=MMETSP0800-20121206/29201_1 /TAXON_ID=210618 ORGANISM="Striatella unipunctata, Strain CCMP2910" /NCGR_SAMPLE_ID=MMETSP0800 /ASSEMBLY_ACC=CAM_ASM_000638 /LENGTH=820 /DNA_ID=CAMNT_0006626259 /DNA_START=173 /DNA_END=2635 /DNA_ORIENTATION=-